MGHAVKERKKLLKWFNAELISLYFINLNMCIGGVISFGFQKSGIFYIFSISGIFDHFSFCHPLRPFWSRSYFKRLHCSNNATQEALRLLLTWSH